MSKIIAIANQKGGVAKTTTTQNIGAALSLRGKSVLLVDFDSQASLTIAVGLEPIDFAENNITQVIEDEKNSAHKSILDCITQTTDGLAWIVPSIIDLANLEWQMFARLNRETILKRALAPANDRFDYILIDCPPALGILTINALAAADGVLIPSTTEYLSYRGLANLEETIEDIRELINPNLSVYGAIATKHDRTTKGRQVLELMLAEYDVLTVVKKLTEAVSGIYDGRSVVEQLPDSEISRAYGQVADMIIADKFMPLTEWAWK